MQVDILIIGQGISGTFLSYYLQKENTSFVVIDNGFVNAPSRVAAGIINPVTGRRIVTVWKAEELFTFAWQAYNEIGHQLGITAISQKNIIDFFPNPFMRESFLKRIEENAEYLHSFPEQNHFNPYFNYEFGCGEIRPAYTAHLETLIPAWRSHLQQNNQLRGEEFDSAFLQVSSDKVVYKDIIADKIIFCDGAGTSGNHFFKQLPFAPNKGEALVVEIPGLPQHHIYKKSMTLAPLAEKDMFWVGSVYHWNFDNAEPTLAFRKNTEAVLKEWLKVPFRIVEHRCGIRPATIERRPFVGFHPLHKNIGIFNGMGTKGCSLAPYFAKQFIDHILYNLEIDPEANINRFQKILSRN